MSGAELPEELSHWPSNLYELLGVADTDDVQTVRRAYTRRIKRFKPEHFPEHFRRLREAYESVSQWARWREASPPEQPEWSEPLVRATEEHTPVVDPPVRNAAGEHLPVIRPSPPPALPRTLGGELDEAWNLACESDPRAAYLRLKQLAAQHTSSEALCVRLYWLRSLWPDWQEERSAFSWLALGLSRSGGRTLRGLTARELERDPHQAFGPSYEELLGRELPHDLLADLFAWRWRAAARLKLHLLILQDFETDARKLATQDPAIWHRLCLHALQWLVWSPEREAETLLACINSDPGFPLPLSGELDRLEQLLHVSAEWRGLRGVPGIAPTFLQAIPEIMQENDFRSTRRLLRMAETLVASAEESIHSFDHFRHQAGSLLMLLQNRLLMLGRNVELNEDRLPTIAWELIQAVGNEPYQKHRPRIAQYLLFENLPVGIAAEAIQHWASRNAQPCPPLAGSLQSDLSLACVVAAGIALNG